MAAKLPFRIAFGPNKYAALHLLLSRWLRLYAERDKRYCYVTLGGTELRDIPSLGFVDMELTTSVWSYETNFNRFQLAEGSVVELASCGITVQLQHATFWSHRRQLDLPHIFFVDLQGICAWGDYDRQFANLFQNEVIREGDCLLITSHLGRNRGTEAIRNLFGGEFAVLGIDDSSDAIIKNIFRRAHPTMTLFKALCLNGIQSELSLRCFGIAKYHDKSPMGLYGYVIAPGRTELATFVGDSDTKYFDINRGRICEPTNF